MTAQISDKIKYQGEFYKLAGLNGTGLFDPISQGIKVVSITTACWRGYYCIYEIADQALYLTQVNLGLSRDDWEAIECGECPKLFGKTPRSYTVHGRSRDLHTGEIETSWESPDFMVDGLWELVLFTGGMLLGDDFIEEMYVHMGFHPAYKYRIVYELVFEGGRLVEEYDRSEKMIEIRQMISSEPLQPDANASLDEMEEWVKQCFSLEYKGFYL